MTIQLPRKAEAAASYDAVYTERFFDKLAEFGLVPQTREQAIAMLQVGAHSDYFQDAPAEKQAGVDPFVAGSQLLENHLKQAGLLPQEDVQQAEAASRRELAKALAHNADLYKAALALNSESDDQE